MGEITYEFSEETVLVTGGASGVGREVARRFGEAVTTASRGNSRVTKARGRASLPAPTSDDSAQRRDSNSQRTARRRRNRFARARRIRSAGRHLRLRHALVRSV
jgi:NAD(P)-dependent dehydrogenase (short-subunit alcohol dehydrogenase family)